jgi:hypothetical protein
VSGAIQSQPPLEETGAMVSSLQVNKVHKMAARPASRIHFIS